MTANTIASLTGLGSVVAAIVTGAAVPLWLRWRANKSTGDATRVASWEAMNTRLDTEAVNLRAEIAAMKREHAVAIREWQTRLDRSDARIREQQVEIDGLRRQLVERP